MMSQRTRVLVGCAAAIVVLGVIVVQYRRASGGTPDNSLGSVEQLLAEGEREYKTIAMASLEGVDLADVKDALSEMQFEGRPPAAGAQEAAISELAEFMFHLFVEKDAALYSSWCLSRGMTLYSLDDKEVEGREIGMNYENLFDEPLSPAQSAQDVFAAFFETMIDRGRGVNRPVAIAVGAKGLLGKFHRRGEPRNWCILEGELGKGLWQGGKGMRYHRWWRPPVNLDELFATYGFADCIDMGVILEYADGSRRPNVATFAWDPRSRQWILQSVRTGNFRSTRLNTLTY